MNLILMFLCIPICGALWTFAGSKGTSLGWRRMGVGICISLVAWALTRNIWVFCVIPAMFGATSIGYGRPGSSDDGSPLGKFWFSLLKRPGETRFNQAETTVKAVDFWIRSTVGALYALALLPLGLTGSLQIWALSGCSLIAAYLSITIFFRPSYMILDKYNLEEALVGTVVGLSGIIILL